VAEEKTPAGEAEEPRIGVFVCHCGHNILGMVDVPAVVADAATLPGVVVAREYQFMCSDPGQELIKKDVHELGLNRVVVASCSPLMHERTFRRTCADAGLNPYLFAMANIREQVSWVSTDRKLVALQEPLTPMVVEVTPAALVVGGGIAGIQAALDIADSGKKVYLVEREASIGGHMSVFDKTFPTLDCAACILTPKMVDVGVHPNIELLTYSEVTNVDGFVGNFKVKVKKKARCVDLEKCNSCGDCMELCPRIPYPSKLIVAVEGTTIKAKKLEEKEKLRAAAGE
jgi:heterodisulfide reductase subunit A